MMNSKITSRRLLLGFSTLLIWAVSVFALMSCHKEQIASTPKGDGANLLAGLRPIHSRGVRHAERITDGIGSVNGDFWRTDLTAIFEPKNAELIYDLGEVTTIRSVYLHADNNDSFTLSISDSRERFSNFFSAPATTPAGMQPRTGQGLNARGRYLRLTARGGDAFISVGELMVYKDKPKIWPPKPRRERGVDPAVLLQITMVAFGAALLIFVALNDRRLPRWLYAIGALMPAAAGIALIISAREIWPLELSHISLLRAVIAAVTIGALLRALIFRSHTDTRGTTCVLAVLALLGFTGFYNFGHPQFFNHKEKRGMYVHVYDMRVYFPVVKYFEELRFDGVYLASVAALLEDEPGVTRSSIADVELRDLRTNAIVRVRDVRDEIDRIKTRFTPERWAEFKQDMRWFWESMGTNHYLGSLRDHGGNATPVWIFLVRGLFAHVRADETNLFLTGCLDPVLLIILFIVIGRTFGLRSALVCIIVFGATDFPMLGSNWAFATLRFDWKVALGFGVCALKTERWALGGAVMAGAGLLRAFPALGCVFMVVPALFWLAEQLITYKKLPPRASLKRELQPLFRSAVAALICVAVLVLLPISFFSFSGSWGVWIDKITLHSAKWNVNHVGLRTLAAYNPDLVARKVIQKQAAEPWINWQKTQTDTFYSRLPIYLGVMALFTLLALLAARRVRPDQAALIGLLLIPIYFYPANYYLHYIFLLPLMTDDKRNNSWLWGWNSLCLLLLCFFQYFTIDKWTDERFTDQSWMLLACYLAMLAPLCKRSLERKPNAPVLED
ncbi:MAG: hypothetical protein JXA30_05325 [Deltaproteobacteria bacterium]|nr:hypothetical protein [Deltaproteobacteria bacterium]